MGCETEQVPGSTVWHTFDYSGVLLAGDEIVSASLDTIGVTAGSPQIVPGGLKISAEVTGGVVGEPAQITCWATTSLGETIPWTVCLAIVRKRGCC